MDRASSLIFPGSRILAGWWRQLQACQPRSLHVGYGYVHRIEALVQMTGRESIDSFRHLILQALALDEKTPGHRNQATSVARIAERLPLPEAVLQQVLRDMQKKDLIAGPACTGWQMTPRGAQALAAREYPVQVQKRRLFSFLEQLDPTGNRLAPPRFVPLAEGIGLAWHVDDSLRFEPDWLQRCIEESNEWKQCHGFPQEVEAMIRETASTSWQQVIVDRPERMLWVLIQAGHGVTSEWLGFAVKADGWILYDQAPILRLPGGPAGPQPELVQAPATPSWQEAWRSWCRQRNLPMNEVESCVLKFEPPRLEVQAPERLLQRLRAAKSDVFKGEGWLLLGEEYLRTAAVLSLTPS